MAEDAAETAAVLHAATLEDARRLADTRGGATAWFMEPGLLRLLLAIDDLQAELGVSAPSPRSACTADCASRLTPSSG